MRNKLITGVLDLTRFVRNLTLSFLKIGAKFSFEMFTCVHNWNCASDEVCPNSKIYIV